MSSPGADIFAVLVRAGAGVSGAMWGVVVFGMATTMSLTERALEAVDRLFEGPYHEEDAALCLRQVREHIDDLLEALLLKTKSSGHRDGGNAHRH